jgi:hypothetical protein
MSKSILTSLEDKILALNKEITAASYDSPTTMQHAQWIEKLSNNQVEIYNDLNKLVEKLYFYLENAEKRIDELENPDGR